MGPLPDVKQAPAGRYRGRFAPSPTGPLHLGSLVAAMASYLDARAAGGEWLVRIEDVDQTRAVPGAADNILRTLDALGFDWDGEVLVQSRRTARYDQVINRLVDAETAFPCGCTRAEIAAVASAGAEGPIYPGTCRDGLAAGKQARSIRLKVTTDNICCADRVAPYLCQNLAAEIGDFVIRRADGFAAYQLAVVVDDADQGVTHIVRGADLRLSTPRQRYLQHCLGLPTPSYAHVPLVLGPDGMKLSKQDQAHPIDPGNPLPLLRYALRFLGQTLPPKDAELSDLWHWAIAHWDITRVPKPLESACPNPPLTS